LVEHGRNEKTIALNHCPPPAAALIECDANARPRDDDRRDEPDAVIGTQRFVLARVSAKKAFVPGGSRVVKRGFQPRRSRSTRSGSAHIGLDAVAEQDASCGGIAVP
jgi:hypothetical protein